MRKYTPENAGNINPSEVPEAEWEEFAEAHDEWMRREGMQPLEEPEGGANVPVRRGHMGWSS